MPIIPRHAVQGNNPAMMARPNSSNQMWMNYAQVRPPEGMFVSGKRRMDDAEALQRQQNPSRLVSGFRTISGYPR